MCVDVIPRTTHTIMADVKALTEAIFWIGHSESYI